MSKLRVFVTDYWTSGRTSIGHAVGLGPSGEHVHVQITDFFPFLYIQIPNDVLALGLDGIHRFAHAIHEKYRARRYEIVERGKFYGFFNGAKFSFVKMWFSSVGSMGKAEKELVNSPSSWCGINFQKVLVYNADLPVLQLERNKNSVRSFTYIDVSHYEEYSPEDRLAEYEDTHAEDTWKPPQDWCWGIEHGLNICAAIDHVQVCPEGDCDPPKDLVFAAWDIETNGLLDDIPNFRVFQISVQLWTADKLLSKHLFYWGPRLVFDEEANQLMASRQKETGVPIEFVYCTSEVDMIDAALQFMHNRAICGVGYNTHGFDMPFLMGRHKDLRASPLVGESVPKALDRVSPVWPGCPQIDVCFHLKKILKERTYVLNHIAGKHLGQHKDSIDANFIITAWNTQNPTMLGTVAVYCDQDVSLTAMLANKFQSVLFFAMMSRVGCVPFHIGAARKDTCKVWSYVQKENEKRGDVTNVLKTLFGAEIEPTGKYEGAFVFEPKCGFYPHGATTLDFESLYPHIMIKHSLCPSTFVTSPLQMNIEGIEYHTVNDKDYFAFDPKAPDPVSIAFLKTLKASRNYYKSERDKHPKGTHLYRYFDILQNCVKVLMNTMYGFYGYPQGKCPCVPLSQYVTRRGQEYIHRAAEIAKECYPGVLEILYGDTDSIMFRYDQPFVEAHFPTPAEFPRLADWSDDEYYLRRCTFTHKSLANVLSKKITDEIGIYMKFELVKYGFLLCAKKKYASMVQEKPLGSFELETKGLCNVRRDNPKFVGLGVGDVLKEFCFSRSVANALAVVRRVGERLAKHEYSREMLSSTAEIRREVYSNPQPHSVIRDRLLKINPATAPQIKDRVEFVITKGPGGVADRARSLGEMEQDPKLEPDWVYYFEYWEKTMVGLFEHVDTRAVITALQDPKRELVLRANGQRSLFDVWGSKLSHSNLVGSSMSREEKLQARAKTIQEECAKISRGTISPLQNGAIATSSNGSMTTSGSTQEPDSVRGNHSKTMRKTKSTNTRKRKPQTVFDGRVELEDLDDADSRHPFVNSVQGCSLEQEENSTKKKAKGDFEFVFEYSGHRTHSQTATINHSLSNPFDDIFEC